jgi:bifunctional DNase/RNase
MKATQLLVLLAVPVPVAWGQAVVKPDFVTVEVATVGLGVATGTPVVILQDPGSERAMPVWIGTTEAEAIARSLYHITPPRPMTHDLLSETISRLGATVSEVRVVDSRDGVYYGAVLLRTRDRREVEVDSRPSDALALALRAGAPIRVLKRLLDEAVPVELVPRDSTPAVARAIGLTVGTVTPELRQSFHLPDRPGVIILQTSGTGEESGLQRGDLVVGVNGIVPTTPLEFFQAVRRDPRAHSALVRFWRDGREREVEVPVGLGADDAPARVEA